MLDLAISKIDLIRIAFYILPNFAQDKNFENKFIWKII